MQVKDKHDEAFEIYYKTRSFAATHRETGHSRQAIHRWYKQLKWGERIELREKNINNGIDEKFVAGVVDKKSEMLKSLMGMDTILDQEIRTAFELDPKTGKYTPKFHIEKFRDLMDAIALKLKINDNRLKVMGEDLHKSNEMKESGFILEWKNDEEPNDPILSTLEAEIVS